MLRALVHAALVVAAVGLPISSARALPACAPMDFDGDCKSDILWRHTATGENWMYLMNGWTIASQGQVNYIAGQAWQIRGIGDFDGDGKADILWRHTATGENWMYLMDGWTIASQGQVNFVPDPAWQVAGIGDFDGDGQADILWRHTSTGENWMYLMNGRTIASQGQVNFVPDPAWQVAGIGDFDGDGKADILWRHTATGENWMYLMNGRTIASQGLVNFIGEQAWQIRGIGDFDGDGKADILWRHTATGENWMYLMNGRTIASQGQVNYVPDPAWRVAGVGDFDGDGRADILWRHIATGEDYVYLMNGWTIASHGQVNTISDLSWMPRTATTIADGTAPDRTAPSIPTGLTATAISSSRIDLTWRAAWDNVGVTGYRVYANGVQIATVSGTSYSSTGLAAATSYSYTIAAYDAAGNASAQSAAASATTKPVPDTQAPSTPANLGAKVISDWQIDLSWSPSTDNAAVTGYRVYRDGTLVASPVGTLTSITGLAAGTQYSFTVSAVDAAGNASAPSLPLSVASAPSDATAPSTPAGLAASAVTPTSLTLSWNAATDNVGVTGYRVYRDGMLVALPAGTSVSIVGLSASTQYVFTVSAVDAAGNASAPSAPMSAATVAPPDISAPSTPNGLAASAVAQTSLTLSWNAATDNVGVAGYRVYRDGTLVASPAGTLTSITGLAASTQYSFTVAADDAAGNVSAPSVPLPVTTAAPLDTTAPSTPTGASASAVTPTSLTLSWNAATDNVAVAGYRVYRNGTLIASPVGTSVPVTGLLAGVLYSFTVSAFDAAGNVSAPSTSLSLTTPLPPPPAPQVLWSAGMETGDLREWDDQTNSGSAQSVAVTASSAGIPAKSGSWVMRQSVTGSVGGTRMARFPEVDALRKAGTTFYVSWWDYYPTAVSYAPGNMFSIFQVASQDSTGGFHPLWGLFFHQWNNTLQLVWSPNRMAPAEGPHAGESGTKVYGSTRAVPVRLWVFFEVMITPAADFTGAIKVWMNGEVIFDQTLVKTRFPDVGAGGFMWFNQLGYGSALTPTPFHHYVDDVTISLGRMPYAQ